MEANFVSPDISCAGCAASIGRALTQAAGVEGVGVDVATKTVTVTFDGAKISRDAISEMLTDIGFPPERP